MKSPSLKFHEKNCNNCRYYRICIDQGSKHSVCLLLGRMLSFLGNPYDDMWRYCDGWKRQPIKWDIVCWENPFYSDKYIPRNSQIKIRKRVGIK